MGKRKVVETYFEVGTLIPRFVLEDEYRTELIGGVIDGVFGWRTQSQYNEYEAIKKDKKGELEEIQQQIKELTAQLVKPKKKWYQFFK